MWNLIAKCTLNNGRRLIALLALSLLTAPLQAAHSVDHTDRLIVKFRASSGNAPYTIMSASRVHAMSAIAGVELATLRVMAGGAQVLQLPSRMPLNEVAAIAAKLQNDPSVLYAEPDRMMRPMLTPNDAFYANQWNLWDTWGAGLPGAWDITTGAAGVVVAVLDTGIRPHMEFNGRTLPGYDFITLLSIANDGDGRDTDPSDPGDWVAANECDPSLGSPKQNSSWHGTYIAGVIGATGNNITGIAGINWGSKILPVRVLGKCGGYTSDIVDAMRWAGGLAVPGVPNNTTPAHVLNLSLGSGATGACSISEQSAINDLTAAGKVIVVAAGNDGANTASYSPANCTGVITAGSTSSSGSKSAISNFGTAVTISAPGGEDYEGIQSTHNTGITGPGTDSYVFRQGTSVSTAHVSGVISLMLSANPLLTPSQVRDIIKASARRFPDTTCTTSTCGAGIIDAAAAVSSAKGVIAPAPTPAPVPAGNSSGGGGGGGGGGCAQQPDAAFDPTLLTLLLAGLGCAFLRRHAQGVA